MSRNLSRRCPIENIRACIIAMPARIKSFVVRKDDWYTICINECLCQRARLEAYDHEIWHIENGDFDTDKPTGLLEIKAHQMEGK